MATGAKTGNKTEFRRGDGASPEVFTLVPEVRGTITVGEERSEIDATNFDSDAVERIGDLPDGATLDIEMNYKNHAQQNNLIADVKAGINRNYQVHNPAFAKTYDFVLSPLSWMMEFVDKGKAITLKIKFRISNAVTITG